MAWLRCTARVVLKAFYVAKLLHHLEIANRKCQKIAYRLRFYHLRGDFDTERGLKQGFCAIENLKYDAPNRDLLHIEGIVKPCSPLFKGSRLLFDLLRQYVRCHAPRRTFRVHPAFGVIAFKTATKKRNTKKLAQKTDTSTFVRNIAREKLRQGL